MCVSDRLPQADEKFWRPGDTIQYPASSSENVLFRPDVYETIEATIDALDPKLRALSLDIHDHPEIAFEESRTHDVLTAFLKEQGFEVTPHYELPTAWVAKYSKGSGGRTIGVNSEMDALPGIGHACGHNLIAIAGVAVACALKAALEKHDISGNIILLGTPAEELGDGKVILLDHGAYKDMDVCLMCHPAPGPPSSASLSSSLAIKIIQAQYTGHTAHAALSPWEGRNALDAAVSAYMNISMLRQQIKPTHRVHSTIEGKDWVPNIIPDYAKMALLTRAPTKAEVDVLYPRVVNCLEAAGHATACKADITVKSGAFDLRQNKALGDEFATIFKSKYGTVDYKHGISRASTDFGNVGYALPALHPGFAIPTEPNGNNHTRAFAASAATPEAHQACLNISKVLTSLGVRVLTDDDFFAQVKKTFEEDCALRAAAVI